jgi:hypothetical protein
LQRRRDQRKSICSRNLAQCKNTLAMTRDVWGALSRLSFAGRAQHQQYSMDSAAHVPEDASMTSAGPAAKIMKRPTREQDIAVSRSCLDHRVGKADRGS